MAFSFTLDTHGLLNRWQVRMQESIWNFNQIVDDSVLSFRGAYVQQEREIIARALLDAFEQVAYLLGYFPQPTYVKDQQISLDPDKPWWNQVLNLGTRHLVAFGRRAVVHRGVADSPSGRFDYDRDDFHEIAHYRLVGDHEDLDPDALRLFVRPVDYRSYRGDEPALPQFEVPVYDADRPEGSSHFILLLLHFAHAVRPRVLDDRPIDRDKRNSLERGEFENYLEQLDVYTTHTDSAGAIKLLSYAPESSEVIETEVDALILDPHYSDFKLIRGNQHVEGRPYAIKASYLAGYPLTGQGLMDSELEQAIIRLANTNMILLDLPLSHRSEEFRSNDLMELFSYPGQIAREFTNPLGTRRGHLEAWNVIKRYIDPLVGRPEG